MITFVVRFWREGSAEHTRWRGRIEHVAGGRSANFADWDALAQFCRDCGVNWAQTPAPPPDDPAPACAGEPYAQPPVRQP